MTDQHDDDAAVWITAADAAAILGVDVSRLRRWTRRDQGPRYKRTGPTGHGVAYDRDATEAYLKTHGPFLPRTRHARKEAS